MNQLAGVRRVFKAVGARAWRSRPRTFPFGCFVSADALGAESPRGGREEAFGARVLVSESGDGRPGLRLSRDALKGSW